MDELKKFLTEKNSKMILLVCCGLCLLFFFCPTISILAKGEVSCLDILKEMKFKDGWWSWLFLIAPLAAGYLTYTAKKIEPIPGYILAAPVLIFWLFAEKGLALVGLGWVYVIVAIAAIAVPFLAKK